MPDSVSIKTEDKSLSGKYNIKLFAKHKEPTSSLTLKNNFVPGNFTADIRNTCIRSCLVLSSTNHHSTKFRLIQLKCFFLILFEKIFRSNNTAAPLIFHKINSVIFYPVCKRL